MTAPAIEKTEWCMCKSHCASPSKTYCMCKHCPVAIHAPLKDGACSEWYCWIDDKKGTINGTRS